MTVPMAGCGRVPCRRDPGLHRARYASRRAGRAPGTIAGSCPSSSSVRTADSDRLMAGRGDLPDIGQFRQVRTLIVVAGDCRSRYRRLHARCLARRQRLVDDLVEDAHKPF